MQVAPLNLEINESQFSHQKKVVSHNSRFEYPKSSTSEYSFETSSLKNVKVDQNINLDFNLVEEYEFNRSNAELVDVEDSLKDF
jgi:hypothetical protein